MSARVSFYTLALVAGLWPLLVTHVAYLISASANLVPWCMPYVEGCTSISRAARHGAANVFFKLTMLPYALVLAHYWWRASHLRALPRSGWLRLTGGIATAFLTLYVLFLGVEGDIYQWLRRFGITFYFAGNVLALMLLASLFGREARVLVALCGVLLLLGLASLPLQHLAGDRDAAVNALEWCYALLMMLGHLASAGLDSNKTAPASL